MEIILAIAIISIMVGGVVISFSKALRGRSVDGEVENLAAFIRSAQSQAVETETPQAIFLSQKEALWLAYPHKTKEEVEANLSPNQGEKIRDKIFKDEVKIAELWLNNREVLPVPEEPTNNIALLIDEKGRMSKATVTMANEEESNWLSVSESYVEVGSIKNNATAVLWLGESLELPQAFSNEEIIIAQTEELSTRGWQTININNVDTVKEIKLRVKLDNRLPKQAHVHAYVFPVWYENRPIVHGVTINNLYRESTNDCLFQNPSVSGDVRKLNNDPIANVVVAVLDTYGGTLASTRTNGNGSYAFNPLLDGYTSITVDLDGYQFEPDNVDISHLQPNTSEAINFWGMRYGLEFTVSGYAIDKNSGQKIADTDIHVVGDENPFYSATDNFWTTTDANGFYEIPLMMTADLYYTMTPQKTGYNFEPVSISLFVDENMTNINFYAVKVAENPFGISQPPLGEWNYEETILQNNALTRAIPVWQEPKKYYIYKDKVKSSYANIQYGNTSESLPMLYNVIYTPPSTVDMLTQEKSLNTLNPGGLSDFPTKWASQPIFGAPGIWDSGYVASSLAYQPLHLGELDLEETQAGQWTAPLNISLSSFPSQTKFLRIVIALYHQTEEGEQLFNLYPTISSNNSQNAAVSASQLDYPTDPFIIYHPWQAYINDPFWLSLYGYALNAVSPPLRTYGVNMLARRGPYEGENYKDGQGYKGFWYAPLYLDWDLILGKESLYWLTGWVSSVFEMNSQKWRFKQDAGTWATLYGQDIDTYGNTALASPPHYWLKNFAYLSYWYLFQHSAYSEQPSYNLPKRFQEPLNLGRTAVPAVNSWFKLFERADPIPYSAPWESSSLSIPFQIDVSYPLRLPNLPSVFGQQKIAIAPDLYSSFYYLQERINHTMLDIALWTLVSNQTTRSQKDAVSYYILNAATINTPTLGNFERFSYAGAETLSCWWEWYQSIPWAKGQAFPKKTGPLPTDISARVGWEKPVITFSSYLNYFNSPMIYKYNSTTSYNATQVVNAAHTIFMSTAHYPLGTIQIKVKKK